MQNAGLDKAQSGIKISGRNINNLSYADDTTLKSLLRVKEESEKASLKLNIQKTKIMASGPLLSAIRVLSSAYLRLIFLLAILIPAFASSSLAFRMMYSAYKLNKQADKI